MEHLLVILLGTCIYGAALWGSIRLLDPYNTRNKVPTALAIGFLLSLFPGMNMLLAIIPLVGLMMLLVRYYGMGILRSVGTVIVMAALLYLAGSALLFASTVAGAATPFVVIAGFAAAGYWLLGRRAADQPVPPARQIVR